MVRMVRCLADRTFQLCDGRLREVRQERQDGLEVLDLLLELVVGVPLAELLGHLLALPGEAVDLLLHHLHLLRHVEPEEVPPVGLCFSSFCRS